jgi:large subunit ribosomal protein L17
MRHRVGHRKLGRVTEHRISLLRNQAEALLRHERIETTVPKARELRPFVERLITIAKRSLKDGVVDGKTTPIGIHARRTVLADIPNKAVVTKLFDTIAPRFETRPGGYTRLLKLGIRRGDAAEVAQIELVGSEYNPHLDKDGGAAEEESPKPARGVRGRLQAAASRLRGKKSEAVKAEKQVRSASPADDDAPKKGRTSRKRVAKKSEE